MATNEEVLKLYNDAIEFCCGVPQPLINLSEEQTELTYGNVLLHHINILGDDSSVLDLGCGATNPLRSLPKELLRKLDYTGLDLNPKFTEINKLQWQDYPNLSFGTYDIQSLSLKRKYDIIIGNESFVYIPKDKLLETIKYYISMANKLFTVSLIHVYPEASGCLKLEPQGATAVAATILGEYPYTVISRLEPTEKIRISVFTGGVTNGLQGLCV